MVAAGQLGYHASKRLVHFNLAVQRMREQRGHGLPLPLHHGYTRLVTRRLNPQNQHVFPYETASLEEAPL